LALASSRPSSPRLSIWANVVKIFYGRNLQL
jgi:hypothetical protein